MGSVLEAFEGQDLGQKHPQDFFKVHKYDVLNRKKLLAQWPNVRI